MKGIEYIVGLILLVLIVVVISTSAYFFLSSMQAEMQLGAKEHEKEMFKQAYMKIKIDSLTQEKIYLRNSGTSEIKNEQIRVYVNGNPYNFQLANDTLEPGKVYELQIQPPLNLDEYIIKVTAGLGVEDTAYVNFRVATPTTIIPATTTTLNTPPSVTPVAFSESTASGSTITLLTNATDPEQGSSSLTVRLWVGKCVGTNCSSSSSYNWSVNGELMSYYFGSEFRYNWTIPYPNGTVVGATCQATDNQGATSNWGDSLPLFTVGETTTSTTSTTITTTTTLAPVTTTILVTTTSTTTSTTTTTISNWLSPWRYRMQVTVSNPGSALTDYQINITLDTASLIYAGKMRSDCGDIRFADSDGTTLIDHWLEYGCNYPSTGIWVEIPEIPYGNKTIYVYYGNPNANSTSLNWSGKALLLSNFGCPSGWTRNSDFDGRFIRGSGTYGAFGGSETHSHIMSGITSTSSSIASTKDSGTSYYAFSFPDPMHVHNYNVTTSSESNIPPYLTLILCSSSNLIIPSNLITVFDSSTLPLGWTRFSDLDNKFPRVSSTTGEAGGSENHNHTYLGNTSEPSPIFILKGRYTFSLPSTTHTHSFTGTTSSASHLPPYLNMVFAQSTTTVYPTQGMILMFTSMPPLGWTYFSELNGRFPRGSDTYGGVGGSETHVHSYSSQTSLSSGLTTAYYGYSYPFTYPTTSHIHNLTGTTSSASHLPPYMTVIFAKRNAPAITVVLGQEQQG
ncbi:MAG: DUF2341 domain-containing protein [Candidatus Aenigmatarchaeota archaeon]